jgi:uncharacterized protein (DUF924 family)
MSLKPYHWMQHAEGATDGARRTPAMQTRRPLLALTLAAAIHQPGPAAAMEAREVVAFWQAAGPARWFAKDDAFDALFRNRFLAWHEAAAGGRLTHWGDTPAGALALVILLDQFPRNAFRGTPRMYASDEAAREAAAAAIRAGHDRALPVEMRLFLYLTFAHSEALADQDRSVALFGALGEPYLARAVHHRDIVRRFGRFPHRNPILGRPMRPEERRWLEEGGFAG